ncbi:carbohydrate binding family 9 domain-containing protein [Archangium violaceum]|uniref:DUF5916 domain-containing protein n=1 Tax=Archangium violaceum TaxID=83451 RepID=UPI001950DEEF|nr:DUF5916 domain-containing protein [Archangium violaceum]QRO01013.1 carbohydrate binding family 9 domain-containing protein [Archangium violaceum]
MRFWLLSLATLLALPVQAATQGPGVDQRIEAARTSSREISVDGSLDEPAWSQAPLFESFVQLFPNEGAAPTERTELRILHDERNVYFGIVCHDSQPDLIVRKLGRRDSPPASDDVQIFIDSAHDHQTAYAFGVNAGGVQFDSLLFADNNSSPSWDALWDVAVRPRPDGWSAEFSIPLHLLRFAQMPEQTWGFSVLRRISRTHEEISSVYIPRSSTGRVSRFGHLAVQTAPPTSRHVELLPYAVTRAVLRPRYSDPLRYQPRLLEPSLDLGLDMQAALSSDLTLNATVNPDFGQVEADQLILNLTNQEQFFPEKRPFFTQGMGVFQPVGAEDGLGPQMLFYSRRIGLTTPILTAAKLAGTVARGVEVGVLDAVVMGAQLPDPDEENPDLRFRFHPTQPLHLGLNHELARTRPLPENYLVAVTRAKLGETSTVGAQLAAATPLTGTCSEADAALPLERQPASCVALGGNAAAVDWLLRTSDAQWHLLGQITGTQVVGGPPERILPDGTRLRRGDTGLGAYVNLGKLGGEPFRFDARYRYASPTLELNAAGFLPTQNHHYLGGSLQYVRPGGWGPLHSFMAILILERRWSADTRQLALLQGATLKLLTLLPGFHSLNLEAGYYLPHHDLRELTGSGVALERPGERYLALSGETDVNLPLSLKATVQLLNRPYAREGRAATGWSVDSTLTFRPEDRLESRLTVAAESTPQGPRWVGATDPGAPFYFGELHSHVLSLTFRQQLVLTPRLMLQAYAQLFSSFGDYTGVYQGTVVDGSRIRLAELSPAEPGLAQGFHGSALNLNLVLRWEYRLGSTLFLIYTRTQQESPRALEAPVPTTLLPVGLLTGASTDALMMKWSYLWSL